jgi:hypothetical protein
MKTKLAWVCLMVSPLVLGGAVLFLLPRDPITQVNFDKIKKGMTIKEIEAILGRKPDGKISTQNGIYAGYYWEGSRGRTIAAWLDRDQPIETTINPTVQFADFQPGGEPENILEKVRNWLGL